MRPPRPELRPTFWEQHGWLLALAILLALGAIAFSLWWFRRPKPAPVVPAEARARSALEALRGRAEDAALVVEVSRALRRYVIAAFGLPPDELTTGELQKALHSHLQASLDLADAIVEFLRHCDEWKFAPVPSGASLGAVDGALKLVGKIEANRKNAQQPA